VPHGGALGIKSQPAPVALGHVSDPQAASIALSMLPCRRSGDTRSPWRRICGVIQHRWRVELDWRDSARTGFQARAMGRGRGGNGDPFHWRCIVDDCCSLDRASRAPGR
jgi:hypothetical protein